MTATATIQNKKQSAAPSRTTFKLNAWSTAGIAISGLAIITICVYIVSGLEFVNRPFPGFLATQSLVVNAGQSTGDAAWTGRDAGIKRLDKIISAGDVSFDGSVNPAVAFSDTLANYQKGDTLRLSFERLLGADETLPDYCNAVTVRTALCSRDISLMQFPAGDVMVYFLFPAVSALIIMGMGVIMLYFRGHTRTGFIAVLLSSLTAVYLGGLFDAGTYGRLVILWIMMPPMLGTTLVTLGLLLPIPLRSFQRPIMQAIPLVAGLLIGIYFAYQHTAIVDARTNDFSQLSTMTGIAGIFLFFAIQIIVQRPLAVTERSHDQNNAMLIGTAVTLIVSAVWAIQRFLLVNTDLSVVISFEAITPVYIFPIASILYALLQHRVAVDTDRMVTHNLSRLIMLGALITCVYLLILGSSIFLQDALNVTNPVFIAVIVMITALLIIPLRNRLQTRIDRLYFQERHDYQQHIEAFTEELADSPDYDHAVGAFQQRLQATIAPASIFIYLLQNEESRYEALPNTGRQTDIHFDTSSATVELLAEQDDAISLQDGQPFPRELWSDRARLKVLQASVLAGLPGTDRLNGFVIIGQPRSGATTYTYEQMRFINTLVSQFAIETERARVIESLERKVRELNVISQVGQAVNLTVDFNDLLELISTQTGKLLDASYFYILLYEPGIQQVRFVFFQEANERYENKENMRWTLDNGLFSDIIKNNEALRVGNYRMEMEARRADIRHESSDLRAWMGVRLTAGRSTREVIGVIAAARMSHEGYSDDEFKIFRDIATLAAASIDKARLFDQTLARERQLTVLNDITRQLVAAEANVERLLELIMSSAVDILNAEAGSLLLNTEDRSGDLEFRVVIGGATHLEGTRWKAGEGVVGQVAATGKPHISNNVDNDPDHTRDADDKFHVKSLIAVPLIAKDNVIGVLEVLNKNDGTIFLEEDREMLTTFA
ncbi:MAG: GAF domain-containing protein, partial [Aggregatilineales bacterium]